MSLERVLTFSHNTEPAARLPLELQQHVFGLLDSPTFYAARNVCRWWRFASFDTLTLARQLEKLPVRPAPDAATMTPQELQRLYNEAGHTLMLGMRVEREEEADGSLTAAYKKGFTATPRITSTCRGSKTVTLNDRNIALFDTSGQEPELLAQRPLNDLKETIGSGPWLKVAPPVSHELALSSDGRLLAVAQERTIQIYDLFAEPDSFTVNEYVSSASGHYIDGLAFEQDDHVLRVLLSGKGAVIYLGTPPMTPQPDPQPATLAHWKSKHGLRHTFLDSSLLSLPTNTPSQPEDPTIDPPAPTRIAGLQLLRPHNHNSNPGLLLAAQTHSPTTPRQYLLFHLLVHSPALAPATSTANPKALTPLATLESHPSAHPGPPKTWLGSTTAVDEAARAALPSAHEHHPHFALAADGGLLLLAERERAAGAGARAPRARAFVYRVPGAKRAGEVLEAAQRKRQGVGKEAFLRRLEGVGEEEEGEEEKGYEVARMPVCLGGLDGEVVDLGVERVGSGFKVCVTTDEAGGEWGLSEGTAF